MVAWIHNGTAYGWSPTHVAFTASFTDRYVFMVDVAYLANGCHAGYRNVSQLAGWQSDQRHVAFFCHQLSHDAGCARKLCALAWVKLNVVDEGTNRDVGQRQSVAGLDVCVSARLDNIADLQAVWSDDVSLLAVLVLNQRDVSGAVRVYSRVSTVAGMSTLLRLKSMMRYFLLLPPPRWRTVILP